LTHLEPKATTPVRFEYDAQGDLRRQIDPKGLVTEFEHDELGEQIKQTVVWTPPGGSETRAVTETVYDQLGRPVRVTEPRLVNAVSGVAHQKQTLTTYDANGNVSQVTVRDAGGSQQPDPDRVTAYEYDPVDREVKVTYPEGGGFMTREFDPNGNVAAVTDPLGRRTETRYTKTNRPDQVVLKGGTGTPAGDLVLQQVTYDAGGRKATETDAEGRVRSYEYDKEDRVTKVTLQPGIVLEQHEYNKAGLVTKDIIGASPSTGQRTTETTYYPNTLTKDVTLDPAGLNRKASNTYDEAGRLVRKTVTQGGTTQEVTAEYDLQTGLLVAESTKVGPDSWLTTRYTRDPRGLVIERTDPNGFATTVTYDEVGREVSTKLPAVPVDGGAAQRPEMLKGYDTSGSQTHARDPKGIVTVSEYDRLGRRTKITHPSYQPPGGAQAVVATEAYTYDAVGNVTASTDRRGQTPATPSTP
jgi:YD repeat-containing protein